MRSKQQEKQLRTSHNKLVIIGNGFDLAHGLKTSYKNFLDWYLCKAFQEFRERGHFTDKFIEIKCKYNGTISDFNGIPETFEEVLKFVRSNDYQALTFKSKFFNDLLNSFRENNWIDIEIEYFRKLKSYFNNNTFTEKKIAVSDLNGNLNFLIEKLTEYIAVVNQIISNAPKLKFTIFNKVLSKSGNSSMESSDIKFLNFNYTDTLYTKRYATQGDIIHIHGRVNDVDENPIIFGYGDESDPAYQNIEDSGENIYLEHIKSFGYFSTSNYQNLLNYLDSDVYTVYVIGHSCGLSDRILLNEIFEHKNCERIEIFYHVRKDGSDNFKELTQEISRHFKPQNKNLMRRRISSKSSKHIIPQNNS